MTEPLPVIRDHEYCALHAIQDKTISSIVDRVQQLVNEWHANNVSVADLKGQINLLTARVPVDLAMQLTALIIKHESLHRDFVLLRGQMYAIVGAIVLSGIGAFTTWVLQGGLK